MRHRHHAVARIDRILEVVARARTPPTLTEVASSVDLPRSTTADLLRELTAAGWLRAADRRYRLGPRPGLLDLLAGTTSPLDHPRLEELSRVARTPLALAVLVGARVLYVDAAGPRAPERLQRVADEHLPRPALRTAAGRLLLALADDRERAPVLLGLATQDPDAVAAFERERAGIARARLARSDGLVDPTIRAVAVPVVAADGTGAAVVLLGPRRAGHPGVDLALDRAAARVVDALTDAR